MTGIEQKRWVKNLSNENYHSDRNFVSSSNLKDILISPAKFKWNKENPKQQTSSMRLGSAIHQFLLEDYSIIVEPQVDARTKKGKEELELFKQQVDAWKNEKIVIVKPDEREILLRIRDNLNKNQKAKELLSSCDDKEVSGFYGIRKIRPDAMSSEIIIDLKSTQSAHPEDFMKSIINYSYHLSAAYYIDTAKLIDSKKRKLFFIAVETQAPFSVAVYSIDESFLEIGRDLYQKGLAVYSKCLALNNFDEHYDDFLELTPPRWLISKNEENIF